MKSIACILIASYLFNIGKNINREKENSGTVIGLLFLISFLFGLSSIIFMILGL